MTTKYSALNTTNLLVHSSVSQKQVDSSSISVSSLIQRYQGADQTGPLSGGSGEESARKCIYVFARMHFLVVVIRSSRFPAQDDTCPEVTTSVICE